MGDSPRAGLGGPNTTDDHRVQITYKTAKKVRRVNQYVLGKIIGEGEYIHTTLLNPLTSTRVGSYAKVKEAVNVKTKEKVAIKIVKKSRIKNIPNGECVVCVLCV